jgi:hypothetical protein
VGIFMGSHKLAPFFDSLLVNLLYGYVSTYVSIFYLVCEPFYVWL